MAEFSDLVGKTIDTIENTGDEVTLWTSDGKTYAMHHYQDCCEHVRVEEIVGELDDIMASPILLAEEVSQEQEGNSYGSGTWTFYKLSTIKGSVTIRWLGESNGYYSERVDFDEI